MGHCERKIGLFADDIILSLSNPSNSLNRIQHLIEEFGRVSYYKINFNKCQILDMGIPQEHKNQLKNEFPYIWGAKSITYLGIQLSYPASSIYEANFSSLSNIADDLKRLGKTQLSWVGRAAAFKMQVLPRILYMFRTLPISIPSSFFTKCNSLLRNYIWQSKNPRIALSSLQLMRNNGGIGLPDLLGYYNASLLDQIKYWIKSAEEKLWVNMEQTFMKHQDLLAILIASLMSPHMNSTGPHPTIGATLKAWHTLLSRRAHKENAYKLDIPVKAYEWLIRGFDTRDCHKRGINFLKCLQQSGLPKDAYSAMQIQHFHSANKCN